MYMSYAIQKTAQLTGHEGAIFALAEEPGGRSFLSAAGDGWIVRWMFADPEVGKLVARVDSRVFSLASLSEHRIVAGNMDGGIHWIDLTSNTGARNVAHHRKGVFDLVPVGDHLYSAGGEVAVTRWDTRLEKAVDTLYLSPKSIRCLDYNPATGQLCAGASDNGIFILDEQSMNLVRHIPNAHESSVFALRYSPDGRYLLSGSRDAQLAVWDVRNGWKKAATIPAHWFTINDLVFSPDGRYFATASRDKTIKIWDADRFSLVKVLEIIRDGGHRNSVNRLLWSSTNNLLISAGDDRSIILWQPE